MPGGICGGVSGALTGKSSGTLMLVRLAISSTSFFVFSSMIASLAVSRGDFGGAKGFWLGPALGLIRMWRA